MTPAEWEAEPWDGRMFCANGCGTEITDETAIQIATDKGQGAADTPETAGIRYLYCRKCAGIPEDL